MTTQPWRQKSDSAPSGTIWAQFKPKLTGARKIWVKERTARPRETRPVLSCGRYFQAPATQGSQNSPIKRQNKTDISDLQLVYLHSPPPICDKTKPFIKYRKIPKISPGAYIFQRPFLRGLSTEGNLRFKIDWASLIVGSKFTVLLCIWGQFSKYNPWGLIFGGAI